MRMSYLILVSFFALSGVQARAEHEKHNGPCKQYFEACKTDGVKGKDMKKCVADKATAASDAACTAKINAHKDGHHHHHDKDAKPEAAASAGN